MSEKTKYGHYFEGLWCNHCDQPTVRKITAWEEEWCKVCPECGEYAEPVVGRWKTETEGGGFLSSGYQFRTFDRKDGHVPEMNVCS